jgi:periplasmic divalent cation tolerance protein
VASRQYYQVTTTTDEREAADRLAGSAVTARVAACGQVVGPINSTYWWDGKVESTEEWYVVFKTSADRYPALEQHIRENHSYDVPEIVATPIVGGNFAYLAWIDTETRTSQP